MTPPRAPVRASILGLAFAAAACAPPQPKYVSQDDVLQAISRAARYSPARSSYRLRHAEVSGDAITFHYQGVAYPGDRAWAIRFATKTSEQRPEELVRIENLLETIRGKKEGFRETGRGKRDFRGLAVEHVAYRFDSPFYVGGKPVAAGGIAAVTRVEGDPAPVVYQLNVVNEEGNRPDLGWAEVEPLLSAIQP